MKETKITDSTNLNSIDLAKFLASILVVAIHATPFTGVAKTIVIDHIAQMAIPFFFISSGYLTWRKVFSSTKDEQLAGLRKCLIKTTRLYLIWTAIYLPFTVWGFIKDGLSLSTSVKAFIRNFLLVGENYMSWPLWYLLAVTVAVSIIYGFYRLTRKNVPFIVLLVISVALYLTGTIMDICHEKGIAGIILDPYYRFFLNTRNGFFTGLLYVVMGMGMAEKRLPGLKSILLILFTGIAIFAINLRLGMPVLMYAVFSLVIRSETPSISLDSAITLRKASGVIYFLHMYVIGVLTCLGFGTMRPSLWFLTALTLTLSITFPLLHYKNRKWFKMVFN